MEIKVLEKEVDKLGVSLNRSMMIRMLVEQWLLLFGAKHIITLIYQACVDRLEKLYGEDSGESIQRLDEEIEKYFKDDGNRVDD